jgi:membrane-associated phospholipid phosphatase
MEWEVLLIEWIQKTLGMPGNVLSNVFALIGSEEGLLLLSLITMYCYKKELGKKLTLLLTAVLAWSGMIKSLVARPRPYMEYPDRVKALTAPTAADASVDEIAAQGYSFPSMHSATIPAGYFTLAESIGKKWAWTAAALLTVFAGFARVAAGVHYPTDVLAGWAIGFASIGIFRLAEKYVPNPLHRHLLLFVSAVPGLFFVRTHEYFTCVGILAGALPGFYLEEKYHPYEDTRNVWAMILRVAGAVIVYFVVNTVLKLPFDKAFLASDSLGALLIRTLRYTIVVFLLMGVYPKVFPFFEKAGRKKDANRQ